MSKHPNSHKEIKNFIYFAQNKYYPDNWFKIGQTKRTAEVRVNEYLTIKTPTGEDDFKVIYSEIALKKNGESFSDYDFRNYLQEIGLKKLEGEWFESDLETLISKLNEFINGEKYQINRTKNFKLRNEQQLAIEKTKNYFDKNEKKDDVIPMFLWNAKMRFGKTFTSYKLIETLNLKKILILTFKPEIKDSWRDDLNKHIDFEGWQFTTSETPKKDRNLTNKKPFIYFTSLQDLSGHKIKKKNEWLFEIDWELLILDEYHFGAWNQNTKNLINLLSIQRILCLSGTPFRSIIENEFKEEQMYHWTYTDEQRAKREWIGENNPYKELPEMVIYTYDIPLNIQHECLENDEFSLNKLFKATGEEIEAKFIYKSRVQEWLNFIRGKNQTGFHCLNNNTNLYFPFITSDCQANLNHTLWVLPNINSCYAMKNLLEEKNNVYFQDYQIIIAAGQKKNKKGTVLEQLKQRIGDEPLKTKTITLTCQALTTGTTVPCWSGIFMLTDTESAERYFQAIFRVQNAWSEKDENNNSINMKEKAFVFDFSPERVFNQFYKYSNTLSKEKDDIEDKIDEIVTWLPIYRFSEDLEMKKLNANDILSFVLSNVSSKLILYGMCSERMINFTSETLNSLKKYPTAFGELSIIEPTKNKKEENNKRSQKTPKTKQNPPKEADSSSDPKRENEVELLREKIKTVLQRLTLYLYLTDEIEINYRDILNFEKNETKNNLNNSELFKKITGISIESFRICIEEKIIDYRYLNQLIVDFKKYEEIKSFSYTGIDCLKDRKIN